MNQVRIVHRNSSVFIALNLPVKLLIDFSPVFFLQYLAFFNWRRRRSQRLYVVLRVALRLGIHRHDILQEQVYHISVCVWVNRFDDEGWWPQILFLFSPPSRHALNPLSLGLSCSRWFPTKNDKTTVKLLKKQFVCEPFKWKCESNYNKFRKSKFMEIFFSSIRCSLSIHSFSLISSAHFSLFSFLLLHGNGQNCCVMVSTSFRLCVCVVCVFAFVCMFETINFSVTFSMWHFGVAAVVVVVGVQ